MSRPGEASIKSDEDHRSQARLRALAHAVQRERYASRRMKPRITLITLGVDDLQRAVRFYRDGLGLKTEGIVGTEFEYGAVAFFDLQAGLKVALWPRKSIAQDTGIATGRPNATDFTIGHNVSSKGRSRRGNGTSQKGRCSRREASARHLLGWLRGLLPRPRRACVGSGMESPVGCTRVDLHMYEAWTHQLETWHEFFILLGTAPLTWSRWTVSA